MLHRYSFSNFYSFLDEVEVDFRVPKTFSGPSMVVERHSGARLSNVMAVVGPNGGGKTNLIKPLAFLHWLMSNSFRAEPDKNIPIESHFFSKDADISFEVELSFDRELWRYAVAMTPERIQSESLHRKTSRAFSYVFTREWNNGAYDVKQQGFGMNPTEAKKVRANASLISTAAQYDVPLAKRLASMPLHTNVTKTGRAHMSFDWVMAATDVFRDSDLVREQMVDLLARWDFGLSDIEFQEVTFTGPSGDKAFKRYAPFGIHQDGEQKAKRILFDESSGTQGAYVLLSHILPALADGGLVVIDELEADLHPQMLIPILDLFVSPESNPHQAQIIFTCHASEVLNQLQKQQIVLVEKDARGASDAWRLDSVIGVRKDDNLRAKYLAGAYGAVPQV